MGWTEAMKIAATSLWAHKLRSILTLLGVVIGVTAVIAVVSFINGLNTYVADKIFNLGADVFMVSRGPAVITNIDDFLETQKRKKIEIADYEAVRDLCRRCTEVGASTNAIVEAKYSMNSVKDSSLRGWTASMARINDLELNAGRHLTQADQASSRPVAVIGWDVYENLFPGIDPLGKELRVGGDSFQVVGVGKKLGTALGQTRDNWVVIPISAFQKAYGTNQSVRIWVKAPGTGQLDTTMDEVRQLMRGRRQRAYGARDDFAVENNQTFLSIWSNISGAFFLVMVFVSSVALIVGGIVIMNIMLVSVTERTREIGLRKSVGARRSDILAQFLIESSTIAAIGGMCGVLGGVFLAKLVSWVTPLPSDIRAWPMVAGLAVATSVGLFFGIYPASKAAKLDPVVALRAE
jgi:putative ABC transport system permease protein